MAAAERKNYTMSIATNRSRGFFQVGDWEFIDQDFNTNEQIEFEVFADRDDKGNSKKSVEDILTFILNKRLPTAQSKEVTEEWLNSQLGTGDKTRFLIWVMYLVRNESHERPDKP